MLEGQILTSKGFRRGRLYFSERIEAFEPAPVEGPYILPGFRRKRPKMGQWARRSSGCHWRPR